MHIVHCTGRLGLVRREGFYIVPIKFPMIIIASLASLNFEGCSCGDADEEGDAKGLHKAA